MNAYGWIRLFGRVRSVRLKLLGMWLLHVTGRRYVGVFVDPVLACNLRCQMCYFSDPSARRHLRGALTAHEAAALGRALYGRALKLQIGCGAEPTLCPFVADIVRQGKAAGVPYVALTTNGQLLTAEGLEALAAAGLDELTLSAHGLTAATYERLMAGARFERFTALLADVAAVRQRHPALRLRVNITLCADNVGELPLFMRVVGPARPDVVQLRPIQPLGETAYANFSHAPLLAAYDDVVAPFVAECRRQGITCIAPTRAQLADATPPPSRREQELEALAYCNVTPVVKWAPGFDPERDTFDSYCRRTHRARHMLALALSPRQPRGERDERTRPLHYRVD